jgi:hypothetical protein
VLTPPLVFGTVHDSVTANDMIGDWHAGFGHDDRSCASDFGASGPSHPSSPGPASQPTAHSIVTSLTQAGGQVLAGGYLLANACDRATCLQLSLLSLEGSYLCDLLQADVRAHH